MTLFAPSQGQRKTFRKIVTDGTAETIIEPSDKGFRYVVESFAVRLVGSDTSFDFRVKKSGSAASIVAGENGFGSAAFWCLTDHHVTIPYGTELEFKAGGSTEMHVTVVALESDASMQSK